MRSRVVPSHQHKTYDIQPLGECRACDDFHERSGLTRQQVDDAIFRVFSKPEGPRIGAMRLIRMMGDIDPARHEEIVGWLAAGNDLADAVDAVMGEWPENV